MIFESLPISKVTTLFLLTPLLLALLALVVFSILKIQNHSTLISDSIGSESPWQSTVYPAIYSSVLYFYLFAALTWFMVGKFGLNAKLIVLLPLVLTISLLVIASLLPAKNTTLIKITPLFVYNLPGLALHTFVDNLIDKTETK